MQWNQSELYIAFCLHSGSEWFNCIEPPPTFLKHFIVEKIKCVGVIHMSSGWFDSTEPSLST